MQTFTTYFSTANPQRFALIKGEKDGPDDVYVFNRDGDLIAHSVCSLVSYREFLQTMPHSCWSVGMSAKAARMCESKYDLLALYGQEFDKLIGDC